MRPQCTAPAERSREQGYAMAMLGLLIIPMMAFVALATDVGSWYAEATRIQRAADAGALAGVVWMPNFATAESVALDVVAKNGFVDTGLPGSRYTVEVLPVAGFSQQLAVRITDNDAPIYFSAVFIDDMSIARQAVSEYVLPVPMGSPRNHLGTGQQITGTYEEGFFLSVNGFCSARENGDHRSVRFDENWNNGSQAPLCPDASGGATVAPVGDSPGVNSVPNTPSGTYTHWKYNDTYVQVDPYEYYVEVSDTTSPIEIYIFSPGTTNGANSKPNNDWDNDDIVTTFSIKGPDGTPLDESDNVAFPACPGREYGNGASPTYSDSTAAPTAVINGATYALFCTIPSGSPTGRYIMAVNQVQGAQDSIGQNSFSILAKVQGGANVCDTRASEGDYDAACPGVYAKEWMSIMAAADDTAAEFFLAEIDDEHEGKVMKISLFDPGEGGNYIQILDPNGNSVEFEWETADGSLSGTADTSTSPDNSLSVSGTKPNPPYEVSTSRFSNKTVVLEIPLPGDFTTSYGTARWWKVFYDFGTSNVTDRTTWAVSILGDPVRLVE